MANTLWMGIVHVQEVTYPCRDCLLYCTHKIRIGCDATAVVQGDKIVKKYGQHNHDTNPVQKWVREEDQTPEEGGEPQHDQAEERGAGEGE